MRRKIGPLVNSSQARLRVDTWQLYRTPDYFDAVLIPVEEGRKGRVNKAQETPTDGVFESRPL